MPSTLKLLIDGQLVSGKQSLDVINPATGKTFITISRADVSQAVRAIAAAKSAFPAWSKLSYAERASHLRRFAEGIKSRSEEFSQMLTREQGKPIAEARWEVNWTIDQLLYHSSLELRPQIIREHATEKIIEQRLARGVVAAIAPWNYPLQILIAKVGAALITGNTVIAKPAPTTPATTLMLGEVAAGIFPAGVFQTLVDRNDLGPILTSHPDIAFVSFTGSTATGKKVLSSTVDTLKGTSLELGGNDAAIVLDDVDVKAVAAKVYSAGFLNAGQICFSAKRVYVPNAIMDSFVAELVALARQEKVGDGLDPATTMGPLQNRMQYDRVRELIDDARKSGTIVAGGDAVEGGGYFIPPTIVTGLPDNHRLVVEEQFGPLMPVLGYDDLDDVVRRANDSKFGLGATIWTADPEKGMAIASRIESGTVWVNTHVSLPFDVPFGGAKESGIGQQGGLEGLKDFTQVRIINVALGGGLGDKTPTQPNTSASASRFPAKLRTTTIDGLSIRYARAPRRGVETLLLLSPWPESLMAYLQMWAPLAERFDVLAMDLPGFGGSQGRPDVIAPEAMGNFIVEAVRRLGLTRPHAVGPDVGTSALLFAAANHPAAFASITVGSGAASFPLEVGTGLHDLIELPADDLRAIVAEELIDSVLTNLDHYAVPEFVRQDYIESYRGERYAESARFVRRYPEQLEQLKGRLGEIRTPVLVIAGRDDPFVPVSNGRYLIERLPNARLEVVPAGHFVWEDAAQTYAELVIDWATSHIGN